MGIGRRLTLLLVILGIAVASAACGRKGPPEPPPGSTYPHQYPSDPSHRPTETPPPEPR